MAEYLKLLLNNILFKGIDEATLRQIIDFHHIHIEKYKKNTIIIQKGDPCLQAGFLISGLLAAQQFTSEGDSLLIHTFQENSPFSLALCMQDTSAYPFSLLSLQDSTVLYIPFEQIRELLRKSSTFNENVLRFLSLRILNLHKKLQLMQNKNVRSRLQLFFSEEYQTSGQIQFRLPYSKVMLANLLGIARPSLSRELKHMCEEGLLQVNGRDITLLQTEYFKETSIGL